MYPEDLRDLLDECDDEIDKYWLELEQGKKTVSQWYSGMSSLLALFFLSALMIGLQKASERVSKSKYLELKKKISGKLQGQLEYLKGFRDEIDAAQDSGQDLKRSWRKRSQMYTGSVQQPYWIGRLYPILLNLPMPGDGSTACLSNCRCWWRQVIIDAELGDYDLYWELGIADHCPDCKRRNKMWYPLQVRGGALITPLVTKGFSFKHLQGQHNQKKHGYRYGGALRPSQARELVREGLWEDYLERARAFLGKGARPLPTEEEFRSAQTFIKNARQEYAKSLDELDKAQEDADKEDVRMTKRLETYDKRTDANNLIYSLSDQIRKLEDEFSDEYHQKKALLDVQRDKAVAEEDWDKASKINAKIGKLYLERSKKIGSLNDGTYYDSNYNKRKIALNPLRKELNNAIAERDRLDQEFNNLATISNPRSYMALANARKNVDLALEKYLSSTEGARRTAMVYLRNEANKIRKQFIQEDAKGGNRTIAALEKQRDEMQQKLLDEIENHPKGTIYPGNPAMEHQLYSIQSRINRIKEGDAANRDVKSRLQDAIMMSDKDHMRVKAEVETPVKDRYFRDSDDIDIIQARREEGANIFSYFVGRNILMERATVGIKNVTDDIYDGRAYATSGNIFLFSYNNKATIVHELGHALEHYDPAISRETQRFLGRRTRGTPKEKLVDITGNKNYFEHEMTQKDDFLHPYIGKDYSGRASEVVSMGLQMFFEGDVYKMANLDPDMFAYIYSVVRLGTD